jgi:hypothetical protein
MIKIARRAVIGACLATVAAGAAWAAQDNYDRRVTVNNNTGVTLTHLYSTNSGQASWGSDLLGSGVIGSGSGVRVNFDDGTGACLFDVRARFADGDVVEQYRINVCQVSYINFN